MSWRELAVGCVMEPWRFDPAAASAAANQVIRAGANALAFLRTWVSQAADGEEAMAAVIATRIAVAPVPVYARADTFRPDAPHLPHHPFVLSLDLPFLPTATSESGGAMLAPADFIEACFHHGVLRESLLEPEDPFRAVLALIASESWDALILPDARQRASRMVRWQAVRAMGRIDLLARCEPSTAEDQQFEEWWHTVGLQAAGAQG
ncbi:MAG TPA: hypothetical protein VF626_00070 [Chthoniobacterales bacterium]